jgi:hypothetical protein
MKSFEPNTNAQPHLTWILPIASIVIPEDLTDLEKAVLLRAMEHTYGAATIATTQENELLLSLTPQEIATQLVDENGPPQSCLIVVPEEWSQAKNKLPHHLWQYLKRSHQEAIRKNVSTTPFATFNIARGREGEGCFVTLNTHIAGNDTPSTNTYHMRNGRVQDITHDTASRAHKDLRLRSVLSHPERMCEGVDNVVTPPTNFWGGPCTTTIKRVCMMTEHDRDETIKPDVVMAAVTENTPELAQLDSAENFEIITGLSKIQLILANPDPETYYLLDESVLHHFKENEDSPVIDMFPALHKNVVTIFSTSTPETRTNYTVTLISKIPDDEKLAVDVFSVRLGQHESEFITTRVDVPELPKKWKPTFITEELELGD